MNESVENKVINTTKAHIAFGVVLWVIVAIAITIAVAAMFPGIFLFSF